MPFTSFSDTLSYLYSLLPMYQRQGASAFKKGLANTLQLCEALGNPQKHFKAIHIGGTNGKGSVSSMLCSVLMEAGYKVGLYTSPHLVSFTERMRVNGKQLPEEQVIQFVNNHQALIEEIQPSFFELTVAMAFHEFARQKVEVAVVEVGLGGRLDSTNILLPALSVITNISYDHQAMLGETLTEIAGEKAGIIKEKVPIVIGESHPESKPVFLAKSQEKGSPIIFADQAYILENSQIHATGQELILRKQKDPGTSLRFTIDLVGTYQQPNLITALTSLDVLKKMNWPIEQKYIISGLNSVSLNTGIKGRMEMLQSSPLTYCDVGHNEAGVQAIFQQISHMGVGELWVIWGMVKDKQHENILNILPKGANYFWVRPEVPRGLETDILQEKALQAGLRGEAMPDIETAWEQCISQAAKDALIFIGGSTFTVADALSKISF
ncbi:MAG: folylpolyglutamate synthase/dihydrofolate synthase family protein [Bacteroidota bacterium]